MAEFGLAEYFGMAEALGIIGTAIIVLFYSRRQMQKLSVDIESKVLNDLDDKIHEMAATFIQKPYLVGLLDKTQPASEEVVFAYYILYMCSHAFHMRQRGIVSDNEWEGWLRWMRSAFALGTISDHWKKEIDPRKWFDPDFENFIDNEIIQRAKLVAGESK